MLATGVFQPFVKFSYSFFSINLSIWSPSIMSGLRWLCLFIIVSELEEKTCSHGTEEAWIGR
ncbi:hypothetical protein BS47DRAFT_1426960 [Hydnum rufescens UP504]|uniref:Uncharacterized protein n=1 Tax=Hydnum rufescens UP504 TaxID=1448309 RepID=A0A9P6BBE1_9AGAM|nr:hypothetical protein BS47DRAFT_1426960 [Hydnum rufescens UP504]